MSYDEETRKGRNGKKKKYKRDRIISRAEYSQAESATSLSLSLASESMRPIGMDL